MKTAEKRYRTANPRDDSTIGNSGADRSLPTPPPALETPPQQRRPTDRRPVVAVYRDLILAPSETFIRRQALALRHWEPILLGSHRIAAGLDPSPLNVQTLFESTYPGGRGAAALKRLMLQGRLGRLMAELQPRLMHIHFCTDAVKLLRRAYHVLPNTLVVTAHGYDASTPVSNGGLRVRDWNLLAQKVTLFMAVSDYIAQQLISRGVPSDAVRRVYIGVPGRETPNRLPPPEPTLLFVGRLEKRKGVAQFLIISELVRRRDPRLRIRVVGSGPEMDSAKALAQSFRLPVDFLGYLPEQDVEREMARASVLVLPSILPEGLPTVLMEAAASGLPVAGFDIGGVRESFPAPGHAHHNALLAAPGDVAALAGGIVKLLGDAEGWCRASGEVQAKWRKDFDLGRQAVRVEEVYSEALALTHAGVGVGPRRYTATAVLRHGVQR